MASTPGLPSRALALLVAAAAMLSLAPCAPATTVLAQSVESLSVGSEVVVRGTVESLKGYDEVGGHPLRLAKVRLIERVAGEAPDVVFVRLPGGAGSDGRQWMVPGVPELAPGDEVLLFLERVPRAATARATMPAGGEATGARATAIPADAPAPSDQWIPMSLAVGAYRVVREGDEATAIQDAAAEGLRQVGDSAKRAPAKARLADIERQVRDARAKAPKPAPGGKAPGTRP